MKAIQELGVFAGVVLAVTLLYNIACILVFQALPEVTYSAMYSILFLCEGFFFVVSGILLIIFSLISTSEIERVTYQPVEGGIWMEKRFLQKMDLSTRDVLLRLIKGVILITIGVPFLFLFIIHSL